MGADPDSITISGYSLGAFMAQEIGVIYSSRIKGVGIVGGGIFGVEDSKPENKEDLDPTSRMEKSIKKVNELF